MEKNNLTGFAIFVEVMGFLRIAILPTILGSVIGFVIYGLTKTKTGLVCGIFFALLGLALGIKWAIHVWNTNGTMNFLSARDASPDLDHIGREPVKSDPEKKDENQDHKNLS